MLKWVTSKYLLYLNNILDTLGIYHFRPDDAFVMPALSSSRFNSSGNSRIVMRHFSCSDVKKGSLSFCFEIVRESSTCQSEVVLSCQPNAQITAEGTLRLVETTYTTVIRNSKDGAQGFLQVFHQGQWGTVCKDKFNYVAARVACRQLGYNTANVGYAASTTGVGYRNTAIVLDDLECRGGESQLQYCSRTVFLDSNCRHSEDIILDCNDETPPLNAIMNSSIRLINSNVPGTGKLLLELDGQLESVCGFLFSPANAAVACRQLGYDVEQSVVLPKVSYSFLSNDSRVEETHDAKYCKGNEIALINCPPRVCFSDDDVAISCVGNKIPGISNEEMLQIAIAMNDDEEVERLLSSGVSPDTIFERCCDEKATQLENGTALICATCYGSGGSVEILLRYGASIDATDAGKGNTALTLAALLKFVNIADELISHGANVNASNFHLSTPLHEAVILRNIPVIKMLVNAGANVEARDIDGNTPEDVAVYYDEFEIIAYFQSLRGGSIVWQQFFPAIATGNVSKVAELLHQGVGPDSLTGTCCGRIGVPAISCAVCVQSLEIVQLLLDNSAIIDKRDSFENGTALIWASEFGNLEMVQLLVRNGADIDAKTDTLVTPLIMATARGHLDVVKFLVEQGADDQAREDEGYTALQFAIARGYTEIADVLRSINPRNSSLDAFFDAIAEGNLEFVRQAISDGMNVDSRIDGCCEYIEPTALICAVCAEKPEIVNLLLDNGATLDLRDPVDNGTALVWAARAGNAPIINALLDAGAEIDVLTKRNETALIFAAYYGHFDAVRLLLEHGANYNITIWNGLSPALAAQFQLHSAVADYIEEVENFFNAIADGDLLIVRNALANGISVDMINYQCCSYGMAPALICAACVEEYEIVELLLDEGANVDGRDRQNGGTALIWASKEGNLPIVTLLVESGANVNAVTESGMDTSLHWAAFNGHFEVMKYLVENGANVDIIQSGNMTAATLASDQGHHEISLYLLAHS